MRKSYNAARVYMILGVVSGLFYRELTKARGFTGWVAGLGHILLTVGLILLFVMLGKRLDEPKKPAEKASA